MIEMCKSIQIVVQKIWLNPFFIGFLLMAFGFWGGMIFPAHAAEIKGEVSAVSGDVVTIKIPPGPTPKAGDKVDIGFNMPGGNTISIGTWRVIEAKGKKVKAAITEAFGDPDVGMTARIFTSQSPKASKSTTAPPSTSSDPRVTDGEKRESPRTEVATKQGGRKVERKDAFRSRAQREIELDRKRIREEQQRLREERIRLESERKKFEEEKRRIEAERKRIASMQRKPDGQKSQPNAVPPSEKEEPLQVTKIPKHHGLPKMIKGNDGAAMIFVPAGEFMRGDTFNEGEEDEKPVKKIYLDGFYIDKYPVTKRLYKRVMGDQEVVGANDLPIKDVDWEDAHSYCKKVGKRLPTEAEWEKAARGTDGRRYPWGNDWNDSKIVWLRNSLGTQPVNRSDRTHKSPYGVVDMTGNISEWVSDWYQADYYKFAPKKNPMGPSRGDILKRRVVRGGSYMSGDPKSLRISSRGWVMSLSPKPHVGFRCAKDGR